LNDVNSLALLGLLLSRAQLIGQRSDLVGERQLAEPGGWNPHLAVTRRYRELADSRLAAVFEQGKTRGRIHADVAVIDREVATAAILKAVRNGKTTEGNGDE
jgi:hypothetical protein